MINVAEPYINKKSIEYVNEALSSGWISSLGKYIDKCIDFMKEKFNYKYILLTSNGTCSNHLMVKCLQHRYTQKRVICPNNVYVAAWNPFLQEDYHRLRFIDCDIDTWNADYNGCLVYPDDIILVVHNLGNIIDVQKLRKASRCLIVEDNCEGFLGKYNGMWSGSDSIMSTVSFYANKNITCGEGGAFITQDEDIYNYAKCICGQGVSDKKFIHKYLGYNYRMTNIQAALLLGQLEDIDYIIERKRDIFYQYILKLGAIDGVNLQMAESNAVEISHWMFGIRINGSEYDKAKKWFDGVGIETRPMFYPVNYHPYLKNSFSNTTCAEILSKECVILPSYVGLTKEQLDYVVKGIKIYVNKVRKGEV